MNNEEPLKEQQWLYLHSAGATVIHRNPFSQLPTPLNNIPLSKVMREKWVIPFYLRPMDAQNTAFTAACLEATPELALSLLGEFNWRPRVVGARLIAVRQFFELQQDISNLLLKSEVCFVGKDYCLALASFANAAAADTLSEYLDYYLHQPDLWFDQGEAMAALLYLDELHGSNRADQFLEPWQQFVSNKPNWDLADFNMRFRSSIGTMQAIRQMVATRTGPQTD